MKPHNSFASDAKKRPKNAFKSQTGINLKPSAKPLALGLLLNAKHKEYERLALKPN
jgi:hypothetical protein